MLEVVFLIALAFIWVIAASVSDIRTREVPNWLNFSLIIFALGFRFFYSLFSDIGFMFFYQGLMGLGIFLVIGHLFYYSRIFGGGDAKLTIALGPTLPFFSSITTTFYFIIYFVLIFLILGSIYGLIFSFFLAFRNFKPFKKEFLKRMKSNRFLVYSLTFLAFFLMVLGLFQLLFLFLGIMVLLIPYLYVYGKSIDEASMVKEIDSRKLVEGDWLYKDIRVGNNLIRASWDGVSKKDIALIRKKYKKVKVRKGIPFVPVFLMTLIVLLYLWNGLGYSLW